MSESRVPYDAVEARLKKGGEQARDKAYQDAQARKRSDQQTNAPGRVRLTNAIYVRDRKELAYAVRKRAIELHGEAMVNANPNALKDAISSAQSSAWVPNDGIGCVLSDDQLRTSMQDFGRGVNDSNPWKPGAVSARTDVFKKRYFSKQRLLSGKGLSVAEDLDTGVVINLKSSRGEIVNPDEQLDELLEKKGLVTKPRNTSEVEGGGCAFSFPPKAAGLAMAATSTTAVVATEILPSPTLEGVVVSASVVVGLLGVAADGLNKKVQDSRLWLTAKMAKGVAFLTAPAIVLANLPNTYEQSGGDPVRYLEELNKNVDSAFLYTAVAIAGLGLIRIGRLMDKIVDSAR